MEHQLEDKDQDHRKGGYLANGLRSDGAAAWFEILTRNTQTGHAGQCVELALIFPHIFVSGSCFWFCIPPGFLPASASARSLSHTHTTLSHTHTISHTHTQRHTTQSHTHNFVTRTHTHNLSQLNTIFHNTIFHAHTHTSLSQ